jgi:hypothetical protein
MDCADVPARHKDEAEFAATSDQSRRKLSPLLRFALPGAPLGRSRVHPGCVAPYQ